MIIYAILDRRDGEEYTLDTMKYMYDYAIEFKFNDLARALDSGDNDDIIKELLNYCYNNDYLIKGNNKSKPLEDFIKSQNWIAED